MMKKQVVYSGHRTVPSEHSAEDGTLSLSLNVVCEDGELRPVMPPAQICVGDMPVVGNVVFVHETASFRHYVFYREERDFPEEFLSSDASAEEKYRRVLALYKAHAPGDIWAVDGAPHEGEGSGTSLRELVVDSHDGRLHGSPLSFSSVGNVLLALTTEGVWYYLWKDDHYVELGNHLPELCFSFALAGHPRISHIEDRTKENDGEGNVVNEGYVTLINDGEERYYKSNSDGGLTAGEKYDLFSNMRGRFHGDDSGHGSLTSQLMAAVNKFIYDNTTSQGRFCFPFLLRWALRLYDGSHTMQSAPILMLPSGDRSVVAFVHDYCIGTTHEGGDDKRWVETVKVDLMLMACDIEARLFPNHDLESLENWRDIIAGVDIFVSAPLYTHNQDGSLQGVEEVSSMTRNKFIGRLVNYDIDHARWEEYLSSHGEDDIDPEDREWWEEEERGRLHAPRRDMPFDPAGKFSSSTADAHCPYTAYSEWDFQTVYALYGGDRKEDLRRDPNEGIWTHDMPYPVCSDMISLDYKSSAEIGESVKLCASFFLLAHIPFDDIVDPQSRYRSGYARIRVSRDYLQSLVNRRTLSDDPLSHHGLYAESCTTFNGRVNLSGVRRSPFSGFTSLTLLPRKAYDYKVWYIPPPLCPQYTDDGKGCRFFQKRSVDYPKGGSPASGDPVVKTIISSGDTYPLWVVTDSLCWQFSIDTYLYESQQGYLRVSSSNYREVQDGNYILSPQDTRVAPFHTYSLNPMYLLGTDMPSELPPAGAGILGGEGSSYGCMLFYPDTAASVIDIREDEVVQGSLSRCYTDTLTPHELLNGSCLFTGFGTVRSHGVSHAALPGNLYTPDTPFPMDRGGQLYSSSVDNPFYFPVTGINTVGTGRILGTAAAVRALSEGQFGQFPLYAFTTEGVWALTPGTDGGYVAVQPVTRDVCTHREGITSLDSVVLFPTARGVMSLGGSEVECITSNIISDAPFTVGELPRARAIVDIYNGMAPSDTGRIHSPASVSLLPLLQYLDRCRMIYDYVNQHVIIYGSGNDVRYSYLFSLRSGEYGMISTAIHSNPASYPEALAVLGDGRLVDFGGVGGGSVASIVITRPLSLDYRDIHKTVRSVLQRGFFRNDNVRQVLYGSNDNREWFVVWSSGDSRMRYFHGTPYKFFRIVVISLMDSSERLSGATVDYDVRLAEQTR